MSHSEYAQGSVDPEVSISAKVPQFQQQFPVASLKRVSERPIVQKQKAAPSFAARWFQDPRYI